MEGTLSPEAPELDARVTDLLMKAGLEKAWAMYEACTKSGFEVRILQINGIRDRVTVKYLAQNVGVGLRKVLKEEELDRTTETQTEMLNRYEEVLSAEGLSVAKMWRTSDKREAWLVVKS
jgi:hypothetical protein